MRESLPPLIPPLRAYARALCRDAALADDLVQETLLRALAAEAQWQAGTALRAWLFTILRNLWRDGHRTRQRQERLRPSPAAPTQGDAGAREISDLAAALDRLPAEQREALLLLGAHGMTAEEAGAVCGVPAGTMRARASRGRAALRRLVVPPP